MALSYILRKYDKIVPNFLATDMNFLSFVNTRKCQGCKIFLGNFQKIKSDKGGDVIIIDQINILV